MRKLKNFVPQDLKNIYHALQALIFHIRYRFPSRGLKIIGVTGSSGKSTTANMIYHIMKENDYEVGLISTVSAKVGEREIETGLHVTTPEPWDIPKLLRIMKNEKIEWVVLESSSHGLNQNRMWGLKFNYAVFTNITHDHLDYHKTWDSYAKSKIKLIQLTRDRGKVIYNLDDKKSARLIERKKNVYKDITFIGYSKQEVENMKTNLDGLEFRYKNNNFKAKILGDYNIWNILAAFKVCSKIGIDKQKISSSLESLKDLPGRMEIIQNSPFTFIVNFSHNADALKKTLKSIRKLVKKKGRIIPIFGSAGLRDKEKRWMMGEVAAKYADIIIITSEDPRIESLKKINNEIIKGCKRQKAVLIKRFKDEKHYQKANIDRLKKEITNELKKGNKVAFAFDQESIKSRENAIEFSIKIAENNDVIIAEGKGHEKSLCFGKTEYSWSDQEIARKYLVESTE